MTVHGTDMQGFTLLESNDFDAAGVGRVAGVVGGGNV